MTEMNEAGWIAGPTGEESINFRHRAFVQGPKVPVEQMGHFGLEAADLVSTSVLPTGEQTYGNHAVDGKGLSLAEQPVPLESIVEAIEQ